MLLVSTYVARSKIEGNGLFAREFIPKGTLVWEFNPKFDREFTEEDLNNLPEIAKDFVKKYSYKDQVTGNYILSSDNAKFMNHSSNPNIDINNKASKDIYPGEEITCNYLEFDSEHNIKMKKTEKDWKN